MWSFEVTPVQRPYVLNFPESAEVRLAMTPTHLIVRYHIQRFKLDEDVVPFAGIHLHPLVDRLTPLI